MLLRLLRHLLDIDLNTRILIPSIIHSSCSYQPQLSVKSFILPYSPQNNLEHSLPSAYTTNPHSAAAAPTCSTATVARILQAPRVSIVLFEHSIEYMILSLDSEEEEEGKGYNELQKEPELR